MCLALPMKVVKIDGDEGIVASGALKHKANFILLKGAKAGDYVLLHAGFAIAMVNPEEAEKTLHMLE